jgi:hypothetical protein
MPGHTLRAFADHGEIARTLDADPRTRPSVHSLTRRLQGSISRS